jgi:hypothetical protein
LQSIDCAVRISSVAATTIEVERSNRSREGVWPTFFTPKPLNRLF